VNTIRYRHAGILVLVALLAASALILVGPPTDAWAATFTVTSTLDEIDAGPGDGQCLSTPSGACTLRAAIQETNALAGADTVTLPGGTYLLRFGEFTITSDLTITAAGADPTIVDGGGTSRVFSIPKPPSPLSTTPGARVTMSGLTIRNGAISNGGPLTLRDVTVTGNSAGAGGGGILNDDSATLTNVTISGNSGDGIANLGRETGTGPDLIYLATLTLTNTTIASNTGRGIYSPPSRILHGGGTPQPRVTVKNTILANNTSGNCSGLVASTGHNLDNGTSCGLSGAGDLSGVDPKLRPLGNHGGPTPTHDLAVSSPALDAGDNAGCPDTDQRGLPRPKDGNGDGTVVCDIGAVEVQTPFTDQPADLAITMTDSPDPVAEGALLTYTLTVTNAGPGTAFVIKLVDTLPAGAQFASATPTQGSCGGTGPVTCGLDSLASGASATVTIVVRPHPAGTISNAATVSSDVLDPSTTNNSVTTTTTVMAGTSHTFTVTSTIDAVDASIGDGVCATANGACTLRAAIQEANASTTADTITLPAGVYRLVLGGIGEELAATGDLDITAPVSINGSTSGTTIVDGDGADRVFDIQPGATATIARLTVRNGSARSTDIASPGIGGGIRNRGTLTLDGVTLTGNTAYGVVVGNVNFPGLGGGLYNEGTALLTNVTVSGNRQPNGSYAGGVGIFQAGGLTLVNTTIASNAGQGIGFWPSARLALKNTILANNTLGNCQAAVTSQGNNLDDDGSCGLSGPGDLSKVDPKLGPLADNGGPTPTHALLAGSPAIDAGSSINCPATDQRGIQRPRDGDGNGTYVCDIGAFEAEGVFQPALCSPRPPVAVQAVPAGDGRLRVTVTTSSNTSSANALRTITVDRMDNATVTMVGGGPLSVGQRTAPPAGAQTITFLVGRVAPGQAATVHFTVTDSCGTWPSFVGGGPGAF